MDAVREWPQMWRFIFYICEKKIFAQLWEKSPFEIAGKYVKAGLPQRKIIYLIKRASRKGLESWRYNYKRPISVNPSLCS